MNFKKTLLTLLAASLIGITGCSKPKVEKVADLTGDGTADVLLKDSSVTWLFIGKKEGGYVRARQYSSLDGKVEYFTTDSGKTYFLMDASINNLLTLRTWKMQKLKSWKE